MIDMTKQVALRLPDDLLDRIDARAAKIGISRNAWLVRALGWAEGQPITTRTRDEAV